MSVNTAHLDLSLLSTGESVGTWGIPLNNNFSKVDILAGEVFAGRGTANNINERFGDIESEVGTARGTYGQLAERLAVLMALDGSLNIGAVPTASFVNLGITRLSVEPETAGFPIAIGDNDPRIFSPAQRIGLTTGVVTHLHKHSLSDIPDVIATPAEINQALSTVGVTVTAANLNLLTNGGTILSSMHTHPECGYNLLGLTMLSVTPAVLTSPIAVGVNDPKMLSQAEKNELVTGNNCTIHTHTLANGATDLITPVAMLNQLNGSSVNVTASNLDVLTGGGITELHSHNNTYYTKSESDTNQTAALAYSDNKIGIHNTDDTAHSGSNLDLGQITAVSVLVADPGTTLEIKAASSDSDGTTKLVLKDKSGVPQMFVDATGNLTCNDMTINGTQTVVETTTLSQDVVATQGLNVNGDTVLGDDQAVDTLVVNCVNTTMNGVLTVNGGIVVSGLVDGVNISDLNNDFSAIYAEIVASRSGSLKLIDKLTLMTTDYNLIRSEVNTARDGAATLDDRLSTIGVGAENHMLRNDNPHTVTLTQAITADGGTDITAAQLETLTDSSDADLLHSHAIIDLEMANARASAVYGNFTTLEGRLAASDIVLNSSNIEITNARGGEVSLDARLDEADASEALILGEIAAARFGKTSLSELLLEAKAERDSNAASILAGSGSSTSVDSRFTGVEADITAIEAEILIARDGELTLGPKLDLIEAGTAVVSGEVADARMGETTLEDKLVAMTSETAVNALQISNAKTVSFLTLEDRLDSQDAAAVLLSAEVANASPAHPTLVARLEADKLETTTIAAEVSVARNGKASLDARLDDSDTDFATLDLEVFNARSGAATLDARLNTHEAEYATLNSEIVNARGGSASLLARLNNHDSSYGNVVAEVTAARGVEPNLNDRLAAHEADFTTLNTAITTAMNGSATLDARLDDSDTAAAALALKVTEGEGVSGTLHNRFNAVESTANDTAAAVLLAADDKASIHLKIQDVISTGATDKAEVVAARQGFGTLTLNLADKDSEITALDTLIANAKRTGTDTLNDRFTDSESDITTLGLELTAASAGSATLLGRLNILLADINANKLLLSNSKLDKANLTLKMQDLNTKSIAHTLSIANAKKTESTLEDKIDAMDAESVAINSLITTAAGGSATIGDRIALSETDVTGISGEISDANGTFSSMKLRFDDVDANIATSNGLIAGALGSSGEADIDSRFSSVETDATNALAEVIAGRGSSAATLDARALAIESDITAIDVILAAAKGGSATVDARLTGIELAATNQAALNNNPHSVTITQAVAADGGTSITTAQLETLSAGANADGLHTHSALESILEDARNSAVRSVVYADIDARFEAIEGALNATEVELENAAPGAPSLDARLDATEADSLLVKNEVDAARDGEANLLARMLLAPKKHVHTQAAAAATWTINHTLGDDPSFTLYNAAGVYIKDADITSVTQTTSTTLTVVLVAITAGKAVLIG